MKDEQVVNLLTPIGLHPSVNTLWIVRRKALGNDTIPKAVFVPIHAQKYLWSFPIVFMWLFWIACSKSVKVIVSFYAFPYGIIGLIVGKLCRKRVHIGFVGSDWYKIAKGRFSTLIIPILRQADFFTCTGTKMLSEMISCGFNADRIAVLPHSIDLSKAHVADPSKAHYDCIFIGNLQQNKRVDTILRALALVAQQRRGTCLCIVGHGPLRTELEQLASRLGIAERVEFAGNTPEVFSYLRRSHICIIASESEGFPFALVEAMCCGIVPVCTPVGTIPDYVKHGETGMMFPVGDHKALANCILTLLIDADLYACIRSNVLTIREQFSYEKATAVWDGFLWNYWGSDQPLDKVISNQ